jgi:Uma2 family endonuclease
MTAEPAHRWHRPPTGGYTVDDLLTLPDLPPHTELIDGSLVFVSPQRSFHADVIDLLVQGLRATTPAELRVKREMTVVIDQRNGPEPDVLVVHASAVSGRRQTSFPVADVLLAVEVVSPDSEARDRDTKPHKYANAGIEHFWLVDMAGEDDHPVVKVYRRNHETSVYQLSGVYHDRLVLDVPFPVDIDLTAIDRL